MNRALICASYDQSLTLFGDSSCDDVVMMKQALAKLQLLESTIVSNLDSKFDPNSDPNLNNNLEYDCGAAGTTLRFLALRLSRIPGTHILKGTKRLLQRPQQDLLDVLTRLGVKYSTTEDRLTLESEGWKNLDKPILVHRGVSSQFASSLILNAWGLESDLVLETLGSSISEGYFEMTLEVVKSLGMTIIENKTNESSTYLIKKNSTINQSQYQMESDLSSAFAIAAYAALNGEAIFEHFPHPSLQPDYEFIKFMKQMGISITLSTSTASLVTTSTNAVSSAAAPSNTDTPIPSISNPGEFSSTSHPYFHQLQIKKTTNFNGLECNLQSCPDLFPVLAILCAFAKTPSRLYGAPQLIHKESNRIAKTSELLNRIHITHENKLDGMIIQPTPININKIKAFTYDTDHDHRLAFAAALIQSQNIPIDIRHPEVVSKSFPEFWTILGRNLN